MRSKAGCRPTEIPVRLPAPAGAVALSGLVLTSPPDAVGAVAVAGVLAPVLAAAGSLARGRGLAAAAPGAGAVADQAGATAAARFAAGTAGTPRSAGRGGAGRGGWEGA